MLTRTQKEKTLKDVSEKIANADGMLFVDYRGLKVKQISELRSRLKRSGGALQVVKKTILAKALEKSGVAKEHVDALSGQVAAVFFRGDISGIAKTVNAFIKEHAVAELIGGVLHAKLIGKGEIKILLALPSLQELRAQCVAALAAPLTGLVRSLQWPTQSFTRVISQISPSIKAQAIQGSEEPSGSRRD